MSIGIEAFNEKGFKIFGTDYANLVHYGKTVLTVVGGSYIIIAKTVVYWLRGIAGGCWPSSSAPAH